MRFLKLNLAAFGPFTGTVLDLSSGEHGLHLVYGPNEAGKSAALRAVHAVLFGIPHQSGDNFVHDYKNLRVGGRLRNATGDELAVVRRKGRSDTLLNPDHPQGAAHPEGVLDSFLRGIDGETFARVYGIDHAELLHGGDQMRALKGLAGESLFAASLGGAALAEVLVHLESEAGERFGKRNSAIRRGVAEYRQVLKDKRAAEIPSSRWQDLQRDLDATWQRRDETVDLLARKRAQSHRLERLRSALRWLGERKQLLDQLASLGEKVVLPDEYSASRRSECQVQLVQVQQRIAALREELEDDAGLRAQIAAIDVPVGLIEHEQVIDDLQKRLGAQLKAARDRSTNVQVKRDQLFLQANGVLRDLAVDVAWEEIEALRLGSDRRVWIQNLASDEKRLRQAPAELARQRSKVERALQSGRDALERLGPVRETSRIARAGQQAQKRAGVEDDLAQCRASLAALEAEARCGLNGLGLWQGTLAALADLPVPLRETVERFEHEFGELDNQAQLVLRDEKARRKELAKVQRQIAALDGTAKVPGEQDLHRAREQRDRGWSLVRRAWLEGLDDDEAVRAFAGDIPLADAYEQQVNHADSIADRLWREAERVAQLAEQRAQQAEIEEQLAALAEEREQCRRRRCDLRQAWGDQWAGCGIDEPLPPREMRGWLEQRAQLKQTAGQIDQRTAEVRQLEEQAAVCRGQLAAALAEMGMPVPNDEPLGGLLARAVEIHEDQEQLLRRRDELQRDVRRAEEDLAVLASDATLAREALAQWEQSWRSAMRLIGCPADATAEQANERMSRLAELFRCVDEMRGLDERLAAIDQDTREFERDVGELVVRLAPDLADLPAPQAAGELRGRLDRAREDRVRLDQLTARCDRCENELQNARVAEREWQTRLAHLCRIAGVSTYEDLPEIERGSDEVVACRRRLSEVEEQLLDLGGGLSIDELVRDAEGQDADDLEAQAAELADEIADLEQRRDEVVARIRELENERAAVDGSAAAADADERALSILTRIHEDARRYVLLRLASSLLRHQIDKHRAENQDPLLSRAGDLFAHMTCGEFAGLRTEYDATDQAVLVGLRRRSDEPVHVEAMSDGTRDQLYLALRLAYLQRRLAQHEPMPFIVDDILINFDDDRALATLEVLAELARQTQVIFFTHHWHLVELAEAAVGEDELFVHQLDGRFSSEKRRASRAASRPRVSAR